MEGKFAGYREIEHTADWELEAWAPDLPGLFEQAARGMYALCAARFLTGEPVIRELEIETADNESLLVSFLSELWYSYEHEGIGFNSYNLRINDFHLQAEMEGLRIQSIDKEIKAVTFHNLNIRQSERGLRVNLVFDV
jgi:SHS2 domain-containing protein